MSEALDQLKEAVLTEMDKLQAELVRLRKENDTMRAIITKLMPCHYCGVDEIAKCPRGFPGCALADDILCYDTTWIQEFQVMRQALKLASNPPS